MAPVPNHPTSIDGRDVAEANELSVLKFVRAFGHLRRSEIAMAVWPASSQASAKKMCSTTVSRMLTKGLLVERPNILGSMSLALTGKGAARLKLEDIEANESASLSSIAGPQFFHRTVGTCYLLEKARRGAKVFGEYSIIKGWAPVTRAEFSEQYRKNPDGLIVVPGAERGYAATVTTVDWVEVESSYKPDADLEKIFAIAWHAGTWLDLKETILLDRVVFVYDVRQKHESAILAHLRRYLKEKPLDHPERILSSIVLVRAKITTPLVWEGYEEVTAWTALSDGTKDYLM
jgi:hypothetical protein